MAFRVIIVDLWRVITPVVLAAHAALAGQNATGAPTPTSTVHPSNVVEARSASASDAVGVPFAAVLGLPYSAEQVTDHQQTLVDGTHLKQRLQTTFLYRDSKGRTRFQRFLMPNDSGASATSSTIEITDPVAGYRYVLDPQARTARRSVLIPAVNADKASLSTAASTDATAPRHMLGYLSLAKPTQIASTLIRPPMEISRTPLRSQSLGSVSKEHYASVMSPSTKSPSPRSGFTRTHVEIFQAAMGLRSIQGITAQGTRMIVTFPKGLIGNDRPIKTVSETWASSKLRLLVQSKVSDPRNGEILTRLATMSQAEPDPSLFQVPSGYSIIDK